MFAAQIGRVREAGWEPIGAAELVDGLEERAVLPERAFLVTFDDAYRSLRDDGLTQLEALGLAAVVFTPTSFIGGWNSFDQDTEPREAICDWQALEALSLRSVAVQSHGVSHRRFSSLSPDDQREELKASKHVLEQRLGKPVDLFAYPYGDAGGDPNLAETLLQRTGYKAAFGYGGGAFSVPAENPYLLPRIAMGPDTDLGELN